jgi:transcription antitermination factor NusG
MTSVAERKRTETPWYVLRCATRQEARAVSSLAELSIAHYLPQEVRWHMLSRGREREKRTAALFPGYLFAQLTDEDFDRIRDADGIHGLVKIDGRAAVVNASRLHWLAFHEAQGMYDSTWSATKERWKPKKGEAAVVTRGPFAGHLGVIEKLRGENRAMLMMGLFGFAPKPYEVHIADLEAAA